MVGIPKTIDNDIHFIDRSFGFETAFAAAVDVIRGAHVEANGAANGIGLVKLMGRHSGFIACHAALASTDANFVLIPEVPLQLEGRAGLPGAASSGAWPSRDHAVIVVAEGAGQELCADDRRRAGPTPAATCASRTSASSCATGSAAHFAERGSDVTLKYIDPSYQIRSVPASPADSVYCWNMARNAVHAAMAGNTDMLDRPLARPLRARAHAARDALPQAGRRPRGPLDVGPRGHRAAGQLRLGAPAGGGDPLAWSQSGQSNNWPRRPCRPSGVVVQGRLLQGGRWRTCWWCPQASSATQSPSASW